MKYITVQGSKECKRQKREENIQKQTSIEKIKNNIILLNIKASEFFLGGRENRRK